MNIKLRSMSMPLNFTLAEPGDVMILADGCVCLRVTYEGLNTPNAVVLYPERTISKRRVGDILSLGTNDAVSRIIPSEALTLTEQS